MLILSRRVSESICIGPDIRVMIVRISEENVRIGIEAPKELRILRDELSVNELPADAES